MNKNMHRMNRDIAICMGACSLVMGCLLLCDFLGIFHFNNVLKAAILIGGPVCLSSIILWFCKVPDTFLKYYMSIVMALLVGTLGCFNGIGIYITFILVPVASCLYFDIRYTIFCSVFSYIVMVISLYINSAGKMEIRFLGWTHGHAFRAYLIGFTLEYLVITLFLAQIMKRAKALLDEQHQIYLEQAAKDAKYQLLIKEMKDVVFEYYPAEGRYEANRSIYAKPGEKNESVSITAFEDSLSDSPGLRELYDRINKGFEENRLDDFQLDMSYEVQGERVPLWYQVEYFVVKDGEVPVSIIGKMHDITRTKQSQERMRLRNLEDMRKNAKRGNSLYNQVLAESERFQETEFVNLADGHRFLAQIMEDVKYVDNLVDGVNQMLSAIGGYFGMARICVVETDMSSGTCNVNYQWNRDEKTYLKDYFTSMSLEEIRRTIDTYNKNGYIEVNPKKNIMTFSEGNNELLDDVVFGVILGNQVWIPMLENKEYIGAICFDRYDETPYTIVEKFLLSEAVNTLTTHILKINAENSNKAKSDFLSTMSHEIRTPMNAIVGMTEVALRGDMEESVKQNLRMVKSSAFGLLTLINDILDFSKIEAGRFEIVKESFSILSILNDVKEITMARNNGKLDVEFIVPDNMPLRLNGDFVRIKQVMINYCTNAIKYSDKGKVVVRANLQKQDEKNALLTFSVKDNGIGIKKEDLAKLFKPYTRVDTKVNHHKEGTGLGLAISKQLIELMDGTVSVESEYGKGSTFSFTIPLGIEDWTSAGRFEDYRYEDDEKEEEISVVIAPEARILIVDDTHLNLLVASALMEPTKMNIETAESGEEALCMLEKNDYDLIFMDHFMPGMDGVETTQRIRQMSDEKKRQIPIVALTADAMEGVREELLGKGMNDFLTKPLIINELYQVLRSWLPEEKIER